MKDLEEFGENENGVGEGSPPEENTPVEGETPESGAQEQVTGQPEGSVADGAESTTPQAGKPETNVDGRGVPLEQVAREWKRKHDQVVDRIPEMIKEAIKDVGLQQGEQKPKLTIAQLETFAQENPEHRGWAEGEKEIIREGNIAKMLKEQRAEETQKVTGDQRRRQSYDDVVQRYPDAFIKDVSGRFTGWNPKNPLTQEIAVIMQDKRFSSDPEGLSAAADIAYGRVARRNNPKAKQTQDKLKRQVGNLQKKTLIEGGGHQPAEGSPVADSLNRLKKTGGVKDAKTAVKTILQAASKRRTS